MASARANVEGGATLYAIANPQRVREALGAYTGDTAQAIFWPPAALVMFQPGAKLYLASKRCP